MEHKYPAQLPAERVQAIEDSVARYRHELTQAHVAASAWQQQAEQHAADVVRLREELDVANRMLAIARAERAQEGRSAPRSATTDPSHGD